MALGREDMTKEQSQRDPSRRGVDEEIIRLPDGAQVEFAAATNTLTVEFMNNTSLLPQQGVLESLTEWLKRFDKQEIAVVLKAKLGVSLDLMFRDPTYFNQLLDVLEGKDGICVVVSSDRRVMMAASSIKHPRFQLCRTPDKSRELIREFRAIQNKAR
jgi:phage baseplate assembly protein gpV